jgi:hypothetical protein
VASGAIVDGGLRSVGGRTVPDQEAAAEEDEDFAIVVIRDPRMTCLIWGLGSGGRSPLRMKC